MSCEWICNDCGELTITPFGFHGSQEIKMISYCRCIDREGKNKLGGFLKRVEFRKPIDFIPGKDKGPTQEELMHRERIRRDCYGHK